MCEGIGRECPEFSRNNNSVARATCLNIVSRYGTPPKHKTTTTEENSVLSARTEVLKGCWSVGESGLSDAHADE